MDILDDIGVSKLSAKVFFSKVNYSFKYHGTFGNAKFNFKKSLLYSTRKKGRK